MRSVDFHCHFIPPALVDLIRSEGADHSITIVPKDGKETVSFAGREATQTFPRGMLDLTDRLRWMDESGIDVQVLSAWMDFSAYRLDPADGCWLARSLNELTAEAIAPYGDRFLTMAAVPLQAPDLAAQELRYAVETLGMVAVEIATSVADRELDDPTLAPFWAAAQDLDVVVLVHPYASLGNERLGAYFLSNIVGNPAEETVAAAHLIYGGVLERYPRLKICLTHGGGFLPYQVGRQDRGFVSRPDLTSKNLSTEPSAFLQRFFYDTIVHDPQALAFLVSRVGGDRVVLGSDYPFPMGDPDPIGTVRQAGLPDEVVGAILSGNILAALQRAPAP